MGGGNKKTSTTAASTNHAESSGSGGSPTFRVVMLNAPPSLKNKEVSMPLKELNMTSGLQRNLREGLSWAPVCTWYTLGNCRNGENCNYIHPKWHLVEKYEWKGVAPHCDSDARERIVQANSKLLSGGGGQQANHTTSAALLDAVEALGRQPTTAGDQLLCVMHVLRHERKNLTPLRSEVSNAWLRHFDATDKAVRNRSIEEAVKHKLLVAIGGQGADARLCLPDVAASLGVSQDSSSHDEAEAATTSKSSQRKPESAAKSAEKLSQMRARVLSMVAKVNEKSKQAKHPPPFDVDALAASAVAATDADAFLEDLQRKVDKEQAALSNNNNGAATTKPSSAQPSTNSSSSKGTSAWKKVAATTNAPAATTNLAEPAAPPKSSESPIAPTTTTTEGPRWAGLFATGSSAGKSAARAALQDAPALENAAPIAAATAPSKTNKPQPQPKAAATAPSSLAAADVLQPAADEDAALSLLPADITSAVFSSNSPQQATPPTLWDASERGLTFNTANVADDAMAGMLDPTNPWSLTFRVTPQDSAVATPQDSPPRPITAHLQALRGQLTAIHQSDVMADRSKFEYAEQCAPTFACAACSRVPLQPVDLGCEHLMCKACLEQQLNEQFNTCCPRCSREINRVGNPTASLLTFFKQQQVLCKQCTWKGQRSAYDRHECREISAKHVVKEVENHLAAGDIKNAVLSCRAFARSLENAPSREGILWEQKEHIVKIFCLESSCLWKLERYEEAASRAREAIGIDDTSAEAQYRLGAALEKIPSSWAAALAAFDKCLALDSSRTEIIGDMRALHARMLPSVRASAKEFRPPPPYVLPVERPLQTHTRHLDPDTNNLYWADHGQKRTFWYAPEAQQQQQAAPPPRRSPQDSPSSPPAPPAPKGPQPLFGGNAQWRPPHAQPGAPPPRTSPPQYPHAAAYGAPPPPPPPLPNGSSEGAYGYGYGNRSYGAMPPHHHHHHHHHLHHHNHAMYPGGSPYPWQDPRAGPRGGMAPPHAQHGFSMNTGTSSAAALRGGAASNNSSAPQYRFTSKAVNVSEGPY